MSILSFLFWLFSPTPALAQAPQLGSTISLMSMGAGWVSGLATAFTGAGYAGGLEGISGAVVGSVWLVLLPVGVFLVVRAGFSLIISQDEGKLSTAKRTITGTLIGIMLVFISQRLVTAFYLNGGITNDANASQLQNILYGIVNWSLVTMAALGMLMIVVSVIRALASFGKEDGVANMRQTITGVATGILMISLLPAVKLTLGIVDLSALGEGSTHTDAGQIILVITTIIARLLSYLAFLAVAIVIYAGIRMIVTLGNEEEYKKSRTLIGRALVGLIVILLSYAAVAAVLSIATGGNGTPIS